MNRRSLLLGASAAAAITAATGMTRRWTVLPAAHAATQFKVVKTDDEWRAVLSQNEYQVLRREQTERPFTSELLHEKRAGNFTCAGCDLPLYSSATKYDSGTGWPSFWDALPGAVATRTDFALLLPRTEVHCSRCGGHLGHVFGDGPKPTGKRHCINGVALDFIADPV